MPQTQYELLKSNKQIAKCKSCISQAINLAQNREFEDFKASLLL